MPISETVKNDSAEMEISGRLGFSDSSEFRKRLNDLLARNVKSLSIDLARLDFMDSAGLGMLMVANTECRSREVALSLCNPQGEVKLLLQMTKSYDRFKIIG